jgi:hypothetical protein
MCLLPIQSNVSQCCIGTLFIISTNKNAIEFERIILAVKMFLYSLMSLVISFEILLFSFWHSEDRAS